MDAPEPKNITITPEPTVINVSPDAFHLWAGDFLQAARDYRPPQRFSAVPYFLLCRAIELEIKSRLLVAETQDKMRTKYGHDLIKAYNALPAEQQTLSSDDLAILRNVNEFYDIPKKHFEYWSPESALTGQYRQTPDLDLRTLEIIASKLIMSTDLG